MKIEIWSDVVCPWCLIGKRRFEQALAAFAHRDEVEVVWRSFELDPAAPREREGSLVAHLASKYGIAPAQAQEMQDHMTELAAAEGVTFRLDRARPGNTFDAHRVLHLAAERGVQDAVKERLLTAYLCDGEAVGHADVVARVAGQAGLDADEARTVLAGDAHADAVRHDEATARQLGVNGVPFFVFDRSFAVSGAQPATVLGEALDRAWDAWRPLQPVGGADAPACGPDGCEV